MNRPKFESLRWEHSRLSIHVLVEGVQSVMQYQCAVSSGAVIFVSRTEHVMHPILKQQNVGESSAFWLQNAFLL